MDARSFTAWLIPIAWALLVSGWVLAILAFLAIGTETCTTVEVSLVGPIEACTDTTAQAVTLFVITGFGGTIGSVFLFALRHVLSVLGEIEQNTRRES